MLARPTNPPENQFLFPLIKFKSIEKSMSCRIAPRMPSKSERTNGLSLHCNFSTRFNQESGITWINCHRSSTIWRFNQGPIEFSKFKPLIYQTRRWIIRLHNHAQRLSISIWFLIWANKYWWKKSDKTFHNFPFSKKKVVVLLFECLVFQGLPVLGLPIWTYLWQNSFLLSKFFSRQNFFFGIFGSIRAK